mgnify:CR=1 FL=1
MFTLGETLLVYNGLVLICLFFLTGKKNPRKAYIAFFFLAFFAAIRYDVGADYDGYYYDVRNVKEVFDGGADSFWGQLQLIAVGPIFSSLVYVLRHTSYTILYIVAIYSIAEIILLYKVLDKYNALFWGAMLYVISCLMFNVWDLLKQGLAIMLVLNAIPYMEKRDLKTFSIYVFIAGLAHYTAWLFFPMYWVCKKQFSYKTAMWIIGILFILAQFGAFNSAAAFLTQSIPYYSESYSEHVNYTISGETTHDASYIFTVCWYVVLITLAPKRLNIFKILMFIGACIYIMSGGNLLMDRIALYFSSSMLLYFSEVYNNLPKGSLKKNTVLVMLFMMFALFDIRIHAMTYKGSTPYETIFSEECRQEVFRSNGDE